MLYTQFINPIKDTRWDRFVAENPCGWICHLSNWQRLLEHSFKHIKGHFIALVDAEDQSIKAGLPIYEVRSWLTGHRLVSAPFATIFDPLVSHDSQIQILLNNTIQLSKELDSSYVEIRTLQKGSSLVHGEFRPFEGFKYHYLDLSVSLDNLWKGFHRQSIRHKILKAEKYDIRVDFTDKKTDLDDFYRLYAIMRKKLSLPVQPYRFFTTMWDCLYPDGYFSLLMARKKNVAIGGLIVFNFKNQVSAEYLAYDVSSLNYYPNHILYWEAIRRAHEKGNAIFDFGRTSVLNTGLMVFKGRWGTKIVDIPTFFFPSGIARQKQNNEQSYRYRIIRIICQYIPKSMLRIFGELVYRHIG